MRAERSSGAIIRSYDGMHQAKADTQSSANQQMAALVVIPVRREL